MKNKFSIKKGESKAVFNNPILEKLTVTHISVPLILFYGASIGLITFGLTTTHMSGWLIAGLFWFGLFFWTFFEYMMHKHVFHIVEHLPSAEKFQYLIHGIHHEYPRDKKRLIMPPLMSATLALFFIWLFRASLGDFGYGFGAGFLSGYASYLSIHYATHVFQPPKNKLKKLWVHHAIHHYKDDSVAYGVSSPLWDWIFGTMPQKGRVTVKEDGVKTAIPQ
ncbi:MAG: sterol desaturase family protein [Bacteroidia bacterium]|nr:sterol desaturase family protein [Bacteroidia bacterium]